MDDAYNIREARKGFGRMQKLILQSLYLSSEPIKKFTSVKSTLLNLQNRGLVQLKEDRVSLTDLGQAICQIWLGQNDDGRVDFSPEAESESKKESSKLTKIREAKLEKSNQFLALYQQGLSYQEIGDQHGLSRERVRQVLNINPAFHEYLEERKKDQLAEERVKALAEQEKKERAKQELYAKTLAARYPERVAELWDDEKNGDIKPEDITAGSMTQFIWLKCPLDAHSWKKKVGDITAIWKHNGKSGCPKCAGKKKKTEKQPSLIEVYPEFVSQYWYSEKNKELNLDPATLSLGSGRKVWFKCPNDGNEWQATVALIIKQQWSKGNAGCRVCNGTDERKRGEWQRREPIAVEFPDEVAKYWFYDANNELGLDPMKLTMGSAKEAWFKCPIDDYEWVAPLSQIKVSWKKGNSGCPKCSGRTDKYKKQSSLIKTYAELVDNYWNYTKNNELALDPAKITTGSSKEAWFKCPIDGYEWKTQINSITRGSWSRGNSGCARCFGWSLEAIRQFVASLEVHIPNLTQAELYKIFEQSGVLNTQNSEGLKIVKNIIKGKLAGQKLRDVIQGKTIKTSEVESVSNDDLKADSELKVVDKASQTFETNSDSTEQLNESNQLPKVKVQKSLEFLSSQVVASADQEAIDFFIASRLNRIWAEVFEDESAVEGVEAFTDEGYGRQVRDQFLDEYNQARDMQIPSGWAFRINGKITPPNLMQKLTAVQLRNRKRMLNLSLTGTGKTIGGILSSRIIDAHLTIIISPLDTIPNWHGEIKHVFPDSRVTIKNFNPHWSDIEEGNHYILLNHEMFQQPSTPGHIRQLLERYKIDLIIVDEIHRCKHRSDDPSKRRQMVLALITNATENNPDLHVLGMSATPVINNLKEGKS